jgi:hypothetical protein
MGIKVWATTAMALACLCGCGGSNDRPMTSSDAATQAVLSAVQEQAAREMVQASDNGSAVKGVQRNAETLQSTVLGSR